MASFLGLEEASVIVHEWEGVGSKRYRKGRRNGTWPHGDSTGVPRWRSETRRGTFVPREESTTSSTGCWACRPTHWHGMWLLGTAVCQQRAGRTDMAPLLQAVPPHLLYVQLFAERVPWVVLVSNTTGAKCLVFQVCCSFWPSTFPDTAFSFPGRTRCWLQEQREVTLMPSHSHNPPKATEILPDLQISFSLAPIKLQESKLLPHWATGYDQILPAL